MSSTLCILFLLLPQHQTDSLDDEVRRLISILTPEASSNVRRGMQYKVREARMRAGRLKAIAQLAALGKQAKPAVPVLTSLIVDPLEPLRFKLAEVNALGKIGAGATASLPTLNKIAKSADATLSKAARLAMISIELASRQQATAELPTNRSNAPQSGETSLPEPLFSLPAFGNLKNVRATYSPCSRYIAYWTVRTSSGFLSTISKSINPRVVEIATGKECIAITGEFESLQVSFSEDGSQVAVCDGGSVSVWDLADSKRVVHLEKNSAKFASFRKDGQVLVTIDLPDWNSRGSRPTTLRLWDTRSGIELPNRVPPFRTLTLPFVTADAQVLAAVTIDEQKRRSPELKIWEIPTGRELTVPEIDYPVGVSATKDALAIGIVTHRTWHIWNLPEERITQQGPLSIDRNLSTTYGFPAPLPECDVNAVLVNDRWEVTDFYDGRKLSSFANPTKWNGNDDHSSKHLIGNNLMTLVRSELLGEINIWEIEKPNQPTVLSLDWPVEELAVSEDGKTLAVVEMEYNSDLLPKQPKRVSIIDLEQKQQPSVALTRGDIQEVRFVNESDQLAIVYPDKVEIWSLDTGEVRSSLPDSEESSFITVCFSPNKEELAIANGYSIEYRKLSDWKTLWKVDLGPAAKLRISGDGKYVAACAGRGTNTGRVWLLSTEDGRLLNEGNTNHKVDLFHFWDQKQLLTMVRAEDRVTHLDLSSNSAIPPYEPFVPDDYQTQNRVDHSAQIRYAHAFAASGASGLYAAAGAIGGYSEQMGEVRIRDLLKGKLHTVLTASTGRINSASFISDDRKLIAGGMSRRKHVIEIVDLQNGKCVGRIEGELQATASSDGKLLLTQDPIEGDKLSLWSTRDGGLLSRLTHVDAVSDAQFSPDSSTLVTTGGGIKVWDIKQLIENGSKTW